MTKTFLIIISFCALLIVAHAGELYVCVDNNGNESIADAPQDGMKCAVKETFRDPSPRERAERENIKKRQKALEEKDNNMSHEVILYTTSWCPYCKKARDFFISRNISFTDYDIEKDKEAAARKKQLDTGSGVPFAIIKGEKISGFSPLEYERALQQKP